MTGIADRLEARGLVGGGGSSGPFLTAASVQWRELTVAQTIRSFSQMLFVSREWRSRTSHIDASHTLVQALPCPLCRLGLPHGTRKAKWIATFCLVRGEGWSLDDAEELNREAPRTFFIPPKERRESLIAGDLVKLVFLLDDPRETAAERMWVEVDEALGGRYRGRLQNQPKYIESLAPGAVIEFEPRHVASVAVEEDELGYPAEWEAAVNKRIRDDELRPGRVWSFQRDGLLYWFILVGDEREAEALEQENFFPWPLGYLTDLYPELESVFRDWTSGWWTWDAGEGGYRRSEPQFRAPA